jgi:hypothetical protein
MTAILLLSASCAVLAVVLRRSMLHQLVVLIAVRVD